MVNSLQLLETNLRGVLRGLELMKEKEGIGFNGRRSKEEMYPNRILFFLFEIAEFQS